MERLSRVVLDRLMRYYRWLAEVLETSPVPTITSRELGEALDVDASQVRKDFGAVGLVGMSHVGYDVCEVCRTIRSVLGFDHPYTAVLIGVGKLGGALLGSAELERYGLLIMGAFDDDPFLIGRRVEGLIIQPMACLPAFVRDRRIRLAILTVPGSAARPVAELVAGAGVEAIWNFAPVRLSLPDAILARNERISSGLAEIGHHLMLKGEDNPEGEDKSEGGDKSEGEDKSEAGVPSLDNATLFG